MNLPPSAQQVTDPRRLVAHLDSTIRRLRSYLQYIGLMRDKKAADMLLRLQEYNLAWSFPNWQPCLCFFMALMTKISYPMPTLLHVHAPHTQHFQNIRHSTLPKTCTHVRTPPQVNIYSYWNNVHTNEKLARVEQCIYVKKDTSCHSIQYQKQSSYYQYLPHITC